MSRYDDIINLPRHISEKRVQMPLRDRAAQFSPFAALTGYEGIIAETGRLTERSVELDEDAIRELNEQLCRLSPGDPITVTFFRSDPYKDGGTYETVTGTLRRLYAREQYLVLTDGTEIEFDQLLTIQPTSTDL